MKKDVNESYEIRKIRKDYGDKMKNYCRHNFSNILQASLDVSMKTGENKCLLYDTLRKYFYPSHELINDVLKDEKTTKSFNELIRLNNEIYYHKHIYTHNNMDPKQLFETQKYQLYMCKTNDDIARFLGYYAESDMICTSKDENRINKKYIFFAVKDNANYVKRNAVPQKEDEYDKSVLCIQIDKNSGDIIIIGRYNDSVLNSVADCTFHNCLDNICGGLTNSFKDFYGIDINVNYKYEDNLKIEGYYRIKDFFYKPYMMLYGYGYCLSNIILNVLDGGETITDYSDKEKYIFMDYYILDLVNKKVILYDNHNIKDCFADTINSSSIQKIEIRNNKESKTKDIRIKYNDRDDVLITLNHENGIVGYINPNIEVIGKCFMQYNKTLKTLKLPKLKQSGKEFLANNLVLETAYLPNLEIWGEGTLANHKLFSKFYLTLEDEALLEYKTKSI